MSIDVQILSSALLKLVQSTIQQTLDTTCVPPLEPIFFDHADVLSVSLSVDQQAGVANFDAPPLRRGAGRRGVRRRAGPPPPAGERCWGERSGPPCGG